MPTSPHYADWLTYYFRIGKRLGRHAVYTRNRSRHIDPSWRPGEVGVEFSSWDEIPKDKWPEAEALILEFAAKLRALTDNEEESENL